MSPLPPSISTFILYLLGNFVNRKLEIPSSKIRVVRISNELFVFHISILLAIMYQYSTKEYSDKHIKKFNFNYKVWWADL